MKAIALALFCALPALTAQTESETEVCITTDDFNDIAVEAIRLAKTHHPENVLLVFDIDNTLLAMEQDLGSSQWYRWQDHQFGKSLIRSQITWHAIV